MVEKTKFQKLSDKIIKKKESAWLKLDAKDTNSFCSGYIEFLNKCKTERETADYFEEAAKKAGYQNMDEVKSISKGTYLYKKTDKNFALIKYDGLKKINLIASHIDSPRLDLKPNPLYEDSSIAFLKSHYYGGIKKYQWVNRPLAIHGVIMAKDGRRIKLSIGEKEDEPVFVISDLLPHLARKAQMTKTMEEGVTGESLNIIVGNIPVDDEEIIEKTKLFIMDILNKDYDIIEEDFASAELEIVPADKAKEGGFDKSLIVSYGQDDKACAYTSFKALLSSKKSADSTCIALFYDKEEIGSVGRSGASSDIFKLLMNRIIKLSGEKLVFDDVIESMSIISADTDGALTPDYKDVFELNNSALLGNGVVLAKYSGSGGKMGGNDASAEYVFKIRDLLNRNNIPWQTAELGKIDEGGGGTVAIFLARIGANVVDAGPAGLGLHSPYEVFSKADIYSSYLLYKVFYEQM